MDDLLFGCHGVTPVIANQEICLSRDARSKVIHQHKPIFCLVKDKSAGKLDLNARFRCDSEQVHMELWSGSSSSANCAL